MTFERTPGPVTSPTPAGSPPSGGALFEVFGFRDLPAPAELAERVAADVVAGDAMFAAKVSAAARAAVRGLVAAPVPVAGVSARVAEVASLVVAAAAVCVGVEPVPGRAQVGASSELWGSQRPADPALVAACGLLVAAVPDAAAAVTAQLTGLAHGGLPRVVGHGGAPAASDIDEVAVSAQVLPDVVRRAALVCAHTEPTWSAVAACGWLVGVCSTLAGLPADPAGCSFELRVPFDAAAAAGTTRRGVPFTLPAETTEAGGLRVGLTRFTRTADRRRRRRGDGGLARPASPRTPH